MPRIVPADEINSAITLMTTPDDKGELLGQRTIEKITGLSRPYIRKLANKIGHSFPRNGIEVVGQLCMCVACGTIFRRPKSKVDRAKNNFCDEQCKVDYTKGEKHSSWIDGRSIGSFSKWAQSQGQYKNWRRAVLERDGNACVISR